MTSIIGLDVGTVRIGVAACDPEHIMAFGVGLIPARDRAAAFAEVLRIAGEYEANLIVVGMPVTLSGTDSRQTLLVRTFVEALRVAVSDHGLEVTTWDETLTTFDAEEQLIERDVSRRKRRDLKDQIAASLMLESYLSCHR